MVEVNWVIRVEREFAEQLVSLKHFPGVKVCDFAGDQYVWAKGQSVSKEAFCQIDKKLRSITSAVRYRNDRGDDLVRFGDQLASATLPESQWQPLLEWVSFELPSSLLVGLSEQRVMIRFERGADPLTVGMLEPSILRCGLAQFETWVATAAHARLSRLTFACNSKQEVLVRGKPLPPVRGKRWIEYENVAVPMGLAWRPAFSVATLNEVFHVRGRDLILVEESNQWQRLDRGIFATVSRIAARMTAAKERSYTVGDTSGPEQV